MDIIEVLDEVVSLLQQKGRLSYRIVKLQFQLDDEQLEVLKEELIDIQELAADKDGKMLVWVGAPPVRSPESGVPSFPQSPIPNPHPPSSYTPQHLAERIRAEQAAMEARGATDGERKTITALFADLKGSTALIEGLDPEDARAIIDPALQLMMDAVHRYDGYVAQALGDGIFALFGAPLAHEDHPQRALYAALRMQDEMRQYGDKLREEGLAPLQMRVGVNTGEVVVRSIRKDDLHADYVPVGHSTNIAARMEQLANPGSILVTEQMQKLTDGYFAFTALGQTQIKGIEEPVPIYEVTGAGPLRTRFQVSARRGLTRFVGRHSELDQLHRALEQATAGHGQIVGVMGEPGLGKSRLFYEFKLLSQSGCLVLEAFVVSHGKASPYLPLIELLKSYFHIEPRDAERLRKEKITGRVLTLDRNLEDTLPYLFSLLGVEDPTSGLQQMDAQIRRQRTFEALKKLFLRESLNQPLILLFEDLHWIDTETQGFLDTLSESVASANLVLLVNYRPEYRHDLGSKTYYTQLRLAPLGQTEAEELLTFLVGTEDSLSSLKMLILERTEGTPFFMEEVVQTLVEEGVLRGERGHYRLESTPTELHISPTVQGVLAARIDRLAPEEKAFLQQLAVIGRQFPVSLVKQVVEQPEAEFYRVLSSLQAKEFLYEQPAFPEVEYIFKHALTQDVAYGTVLHEQRKAWHEQTGRTIEALYKENLEEHYSELAHHYTRSDNVEKAVTYLERAGQQAVQRSANEDAIARLTHAVELLQRLPVTPERNRRELRLQTALGVPIQAFKGYAAPELEPTYSRALELCRQLGDAPELPQVLYGQWLVLLTQSVDQRTLAAAEQLLAGAEHRQTPDFLLFGRYTMGETLLWRGEFRRAHEHLEHGQALYAPHEHHELAFLYGLDPGVSCLALDANVLWYLGYPDQASKRGQAARELAQSLAHPPSLAWSLFLDAELRYLNREAQVLRQDIDALLAVCAQDGFPEWSAWGAVFRGWEQVGAGQAEKGMEQIRQGVASLESRGVVLSLPFFLALQVHAYGQMGQVQEGLATAADALQVLEQTRDGFTEAELYRLKGMLTLQHSHDQQSAAEACFQQALAIAHHQEAKSLELRAAMSLARLWHQQGKTTEAHDLLASIYNWFTEGFDTADLKEAKALLHELST